ncbi:MAG: peptide chain release factor N(5)-glutamine methyltransferase, partial [Treponema sp.]|nr:peptide chain release factor N(5)-glutamine methyltransferase [Treponema sp.]
VNQSTLIPKPDTELLVSLSLSFIFNNFDNSEHEKFENRRSTLRSRSSAYSFDYLPAVRQAGGRQDAQQSGGLKVFRGGLGVNRLLKNSVQKKRIRIADVCTGTACVAVSISNSLCKRNVPHSLVLIDISKDALLLAKKNVKRLLPKAQIPFVEFLCADLLSTVSDEEHFDVIVANPPYVPSTLVKELLEDGRGEPSLALDGDVTEENSYEKKSSDGLAIIRRLVPQSYNILAEGGMLFVESGEYNAKETAKIFSKAGFKNITTHYDLANLPRVTSGQKI